MIPSQASAGLFTLLAPLPEDLFEGATCTLPKYRPRKGETTLWETVTDERLVDAAGRWRKAVALCERCPALDACQERLDRLEARGLKVDGVVAARLPSTREGRRCRDCGAPFATQSVIPEGWVRPYRGYRCRGCYDQRARRQKRLRRTA